MKILYTCDDNYIWLMGISVISLFENNKEVDELDVFLLGDGISSENREILNGIAERYNRLVKVIDVPKFNIPETIVSARWPLSAFIRLFAGELLPNNIERVLYLDCDTVVCGEISALEKWNMNEKIFCGVKDCIGALHKQNIGIPYDSPYINAGVLLIDLEKLRNIDIYDEINDYLKKYEGVISYADQDILNGVFNKEIGYLMPKYNVMTIDVAHSYKDMKLLRRPTGFYSQTEIEEAVNDPSLIHFTTNMTIIRPWYSNSNHPLKKQFVKYWQVSPWKNRELSELKLNYIVMILKLIQIFPNCIAYRILGFVHSVLKPWYVKWIK